MIGPQMAGDRAGVAALVEAGVFEADRKGPHVPRRLDLAERGRDARGIDPARQEDAHRYVRPPMPRDRVAKLSPELLGRAAKSSRGIDPKAGGFQYRATRTAPSSHVSTWPQGSLRIDCQIEYGAGTYS